MRQNVCVPCTRTGLLYPVSSGQNIREIPQLEYTDEDQVNALGTTCIVNPAPVIEQ